jgi:hypothetical protein
MLIERLGGIGCEAEKMTDDRIGAASLLAEKPNFDAHRKTYRDAHVEGQRWNFRA